MNTVNKSPVILVFSPSLSGGIAEHTFYQANALQHAGANVISLVSSSYLDGRKTNYEMIYCLVEASAQNGSIYQKKMSLGVNIIINFFIMAFYILKLRPDLVLLDSYMEYLSPFWIFPHCLLSWIGGIRYAANLHDPIRNYQVGPAWWHKFSVYLAYLPLDFVLVHDRLPEPSPVPRHVRVFHVPVGIYDIMDLPMDPARLRRELGVKDDQKVFLSFGYVRDGKNLDLAVQALKQNSKAFLIVAGSVASDNDKPFKYYSQLAKQLGVENRCHFSEGFVNEEKLAEYFTVADFVLLTYSANFHSQSGVLNVAARARKPVLASAAPSPLIDVVRKFQLGLALEPDSLDAVVHGMNRLMSEKLHPLWNEYNDYASWDRNAKGILDAAGFNLLGIPPHQIS